MNLQFNFSEDDGTKNCIRLETGQANFSIANNGVNWPINGVNYLMDNKYSLECTFENAMQAVEAIAQAFTYLSENIQLLNINVSTIEYPHFHEYLMEDDDA